MQAPLCIIAGVGPGNGMALCNRFRRGGYRTAILARNLGSLNEYAKGDEAIFPFACDLSEPDSIKAVFSEILVSLGVPEVVIYNAGSGLFGTPMDVAEQDFEMAWRINALGLLQVEKNSGAADERKGWRQPIGHRRDSFTTRRGKLCRLQFRESRAAKSRAITGALPWPRGYSCGPGYY